MSNILNHPKRFVPLAEDVARTATGHHIHTLLDATWRVNECDVRELTLAQKIDLMRAYRVLGAILAETREF